jgi:hypothetical protein
MQQMIKKFFWIALLTAGWQAAWAYSLLGPVGAGEDASEQVTEIGYNPLGTAAAPPFFGDTQTPATGPRNLGEGYRLNTPVLYYTFDPSFGYFGANGETAVQQAFDTMNTLTNVDSYSTNLTEFPLNSESINYQAQVLNLQDVKSMTMSIILEEMGLADPVRYTWVLLDRDNPTGSTCPQGGPPLGYTYVVAQRNFDITATPLNFNAPDVGQYSPYVNAELYSYFIFDNCDAPAASPPTADALEIPVDPLNNNPPVASGHGEDALPLGAFYTGLTRDDVAGLRYLMSSNNVFAPSTGYLETSAGGSVATSGGGGGGGTPFSLTTSSIADLLLDPTTLQALIPGIVITSVTTNIVNGLTNFVYTFGNVVTFSSTTNTSVQILTTNVAPVIGAPVGSPNVTNITTSKAFQTNLLSGDFYIVPTNSCGLTVLQTLSTNVTTSTNVFFLSGTNAAGHFTSQSLIEHFTNHVLQVTLCTNSPGTTNNSVVGDFQGIGRVQFVRVADDNYDYQTGQFYTPITNTYTMVVMKNGKPSTVTFQRVVTRPDIFFMGENLSVGGNDTLFLLNEFSRTTPNFINSRVAAGLAGPGIIDPTTSSNLAVVFNTVGPLYANVSPTLLNGPHARSFIWGSFDGSTNPPVVYPNGTSIANLENEALMQISPAALPNATNGVHYSVSLSASGGTPSYIWSLAPGSGALPAGLSLSPGGVISGTPTQSGMFDIVVQVTDSSFPTPLSVQINYSLTVN